MLPAPAASRFSFTRFWFLVELLNDSGVPTTRDMTWQCARVDCHVCGDPNRLKQYKVATDDVMAVEKLAGEPGASLDFNEGITIPDGAEIAIGTAFVAGAAVDAKVVAQHRTRHGLSTVTRIRVNP
jgi:ribosomal protein L21